MSSDSTKRKPLTPAASLASRILAAGKGTMKQPLPIGKDEFREVREQNCYYVDKTMLIKDFIEHSSKITLITRPRRFGKTLNMTMVREFFDITKDSRAIFNGLAIMQTQYAEFINSTPIIYLSFRDCNGTSLRTLFDSVRKELYREFRRFEEVLRDNIQNQYDKEDFYTIIKVLQDTETEHRRYSDVLERLTQILFNYYGMQPLLLIDEYDQPLMYSYGHGYQTEVTNFFSSFYGGAMKSNQALERALLTGIQKIVQANIFSKFNNVDTYTVLDMEYSQYFGLAEDETRALLLYYGLELGDDIKAQYDGYVFSGKHMYNPWSTICYAKRKVIDNYWVNTSSNTMIKDLLRSAGSNFLKRFTKLITHSEAEVEVELETSYAGPIDGRALWGLLVNAGYLTTVERIDARTFMVKIPNGEVMSEFKSIVTKICTVDGGDLKEMFNYLANKEIEKFITIYKDIVISCTSFMDSTENSYHMLFLGMSMYLKGSYEISSNREAGHGRFDIRMKSLFPTRQHLLFEFKQGEEKDLIELSKEALQQIHIKKYYSELKGDILCIGIAHAKKRCEIAYDIYSSG